MELSIALCISDPITQEFPFAEVLMSSLQLADEVVLVNGDSDFFGETEKVVDMLPRIASGLLGSLSGCDTSKLRIYHNPWEPRMYKNMEAIQRSIAISHCTKDYVLRLDADELIHEDDFPKVRRAMELGYDAYTFRVLHFYRDYHHYKSGPNPLDKNEVWYERRCYLFKNGEGFLDFPQCVNGKLYYSADLTDWEGMLLGKIAQHTSIRSFHYGWVKSKRAMLNKFNSAERRYHKDHINKSTWEWDMSGCKEFTGSHPRVMESRIVEFEQEYGRNGDA